MVTVKNDLLIKIDSLRNAVENENIDILIHLIDNLGFDTRKSSMIMGFAKQIIINFISDYIKEKDLDTLRVKRTGEYGTETYDTYQRCKEGLFRNGTNVRWTSLGKLYQAYKYIKKQEITMAAMKAFSDLDQSRKLAEILPIESADMWYWHYPTAPTYNNYGYPMFHKGEGIRNVPCWSLAALLNYLKSKNKFPEIKELSDGRFKLTTFIWDGKDCIQVSIRDTIVDACYEMILKLHKLTIL